MQPGEDPRCWGTDGTLAPCASFHQGSPTGLFDKFLLSTCCVPYPLATLERKPRHWPACKYNLKKLLGRKISDTEGAQIKAFERKPSSRERKNELAFKQWIGLPKWKDRRPSMCKGSGWGKWQEPKRGHSSRLRKSWHMIKADNSQGLLAPCVFCTLSFQQWEAL